MRSFGALLAVVVFLAPSSTGSTSEIHDAAAKGDLAAVKSRVSADPGLVNARDAGGMTPLHLAARGVHPEVVRYLVAYGADLRAKDANEVTALHSLCYRGEAELVALLIARGANANAKLVDHRACIHLAVSAGHRPVVEVLLENGVDVDTANLMGSTPLLLASSAGLEDMAALLLGHGASVDQPNSRGDRPITVAHREGHAKIVELLAARGADADKLARPSMPDGPYLGQQAPGRSAALFAPSVVSTEQSQLNAVFSPDGREFYYTQVVPTGSVIMEMRLGDEGWTRPRRASFSEGLRNVDHFMTRDGQRMFFCSLRSVEDPEALQQHADIWVADRADDGWSEPQRLPETVNSDVDDYYPTLADDGTLVYSSRRPSGLGASDLYLASFGERVWTRAENLGPPVNTEHTEHDPFVAPDGSYVIFASDRPGGHGSTDLYISFAGEEGQWSEPCNLGPEINSDGRDFTPMVSQDGKYLFFTSSRAGAGDIYWVDAMVIEQMKRGQKER